MLEVPVQPSVHMAPPSVHMDPATAEVCFLILFEAHHNTVISGCKYS